MSAVEKFPLNKSQFITTSNFLFKLAHKQYEVSRLQYQMEDWHPYPLFPFDHRVHLLLTRVGDD